MQDRYATTTKRTRLTTNAGVKTRVDWLSYIFVASFEFCDGYK